MKQNIFTTEQGFKKQKQPALNNFKNNIKNISISFFFLIKALVLRHNCSYYTEKK